MKMTVNSMKCISWSRLAIFTAAMTVLSSCGGGQSGMKLGDDEFTVVAVPVSYTHLRAHETGRNLVCRLLLEKKKNKQHVVGCSCIN